MPFSCAHVIAIKANPTLHLYLADLEGGCPVCRANRYQEAHEDATKRLLERDVQFMTLLDERDALVKELAQLKGSPPPLTAQS